MTGSSLPLEATSSTEPRLIFSSDKFIARWVPVEGSDVCVVTFDSYNDENSLEREGFGESYLRSKGVSAIHVLSLSNDWYQYPDIPFALAKVRKVTGAYRRVVTYGTSMGGYAAIRFADMVGAHAVISLSPQYSIDPRKVPFERRWLADSLRINFLPALDGEIRTKADVIVAFDPKSSDARHVELISKDIKVQPIRVAYAGHSVPAMLSEAKLLDQLVQRVLINQLDAPSLEREVRRRRRELAIYFAELANRQPRYRLRLAISLARRAAELNPHHDIALRSLADRLVADGQFAEAIEIYETILTRTMRNVHHLLPFSQALAAGGQYERAMEIANELASRRSNAGLFYWRSHLAEKQGMLSLALSHASEASRLQPEVSLYRTTARLLAARVRVASAQTRLMGFFRWVGGARTVSSADGRS